MSFLIGPLFVNDIGYTSSIEIFPQYKYFFHYDIHSRSDRARTARAAYSKVNSTPTE